MNVRQSTQILSLASSRRLIGFRRVKMSGRFKQHIQGVRGEQILKAALRQFCARGVLVRTEDVTSAVGIGKGTLYRHYRSRVSLLHAAVEYGIGVLARRASAVREAAGTASDFGLDAVLCDLALMNRRQDPVSPAMLTRLYCCETWPDSLGEPPNPAQSLRPAISTWQQLGLFDQELDVDVIAMTMFALCAFESIGSTASRGRVGPSRDEDSVVEVAARIGLVLRRAFPSQLCGTATGEHGSPSWTGAHDESPRRR